MRGKAILSVLPSTLNYQLGQEKLDQIRFEQLKHIAHSAAKSAGGSWIDIDYLKAKEIGEGREDSRSADEIIADVAARAGLEIINDECSGTGRETDP